MSIVKNFKMQFGLEKGNTRISWKNLPESSESGSCSSNRQLVSGFSHNKKSLSRRLANVLVKKQEQSRFLIFLFFYQI